MLTITDNTVNPLSVTTGQKLTPFTADKVTDTAALGNAETVSVTLSPLMYYTLSPSQFGSLADPNGGGSFNTATETFTESGSHTGDPTFATSLLSRLVYNASSLPNGQSVTVQATVSVTTPNAIGVSSAPVTIAVNTPPLISGAAANEPIASGGTIPPFATISVADADFGYNATDAATIIITDGGKPTDGDGLLTGPGLSKTPGTVGTYTLSARPYYNIGYELQQLKFATTVLSTGQTANPTFELDVTNAAAQLTSRDTTTSLLILGPPTQPVAPTIAGTLAGQTVTPSHVLDPFASVTISDGNKAPVDVVTIVLLDAAGKPSASDATGTLTGSGLTETSAGTYTLSATDPAALTSQLDAVTFHPTGLQAGQTSAITGFRLSVSDPAFATPAVDSLTSVTEAAAVPPPADTGSSSGPQSGFTAPPSGPGHFDTLDTLFNATYYLNQNPDVRAAGIDPLVHYEQQGWKEGRDPSVDFSTNAYLTANPDVQAAGVDPLLHYLDYGQSEGRLEFLATPKAIGAQNILVDNVYYYAQNPDVKAAGVDPFAHYDQSGWKEGRNPDALFDTAYYLQMNPDVAASGIDPLLHYENFGWKEGRNPDASFSTNGYLAANPDVKAAGIDPLVHYEMFGASEGRAIVHV